jgi:hypothetical protein
MWPSIAQNVVELLVPHIAPAVSRVFNKQPPGTETSSAALEQMRQAVRGELGQVTASHAGLYRQMNEQAERLSTIASDSRSIKLQTTEMEHRLGVLERRLSAQQRLTIASMILLCACVALLVVVLLRRV